MDLSAINPVLLIASLMVSATPILLAAIGETVVEKAGVLNLGVEGMMITGAVIGFAVAINSGNPRLGFICAAVAGATLSLSFGFLTQVLLANHFATQKRSATMDIMITMHSTTTRTPLPSQPIPPRSTEARFGCRPAYTPRF